MKLDRSIDSLHERIDEIESKAAVAANDDHDTYRIDKYDDEYYLSIGQDPPRFKYYQQARVEKWNALAHDKPSDYDRTITQDELDYRLKERLRLPPDKRYQHEKEHYYFHELYVDGGEECNPMRNGCTPNCRFHAKTGKIEDEEVIEQHNKLVESMRRDNAIVEPPSESELLELARKEIT